MELNVPRYGLIGSSLKHSFSPQIHGKLGISEYDLIETPVEGIQEVLNDKTYMGFNATIPHKIEVMKYCDYVSPMAKRIGSANTIVRRNNELHAYNTDIDGFMYSTRFAGIDFNGKKVIILGSGGASLAVQAACRELGASEISVVSRTGELNYQNIQLKSKTDIIVNTTPVGMYPNNLERIIDLDMFPHCSGVVDIIYNPWRTRLIMDAEERGIPCIDGLPMLVYQAKCAQEIFLDKTITDKHAEKVINQMKRESANIVLIGMPGSGKSTISKALSKITGRELIDIDAEIEKTHGSSIPQIISVEGEAAFREYEHEEAVKAGKRTGVIIAAGGGIVKLSKNYAPLHQNGIIYRICRELENLATNGRPLSGNKEKMEKLFSERDSLYSKFADKSIDNNRELNAVTKEIWENFNETIYY